MTTYHEVVVTHVPTGTTARHRLGPHDKPAVVSERLLEEVERRVRARRRR